jgi:GTPase SAR1 family protein
MKYNQKSLPSKIGFKVILVGEQGVGKTSLVIRYIKDIF